MKKKIPNIKLAPAREHDTVIANSTVPGWTVVLQAWWMRVARYLEPIVTQADN